jgi:hypothetical protein
MPKDVFISYEHNDKKIADAICSALESKGIQCWIAPRDILPGMDYAEVLPQVLNEIKIMILVFSSKANDSPHVRREVGRAVDNKITIIPFRIDDVKPSAAMEYLISAPQWLDASEPPLEKHLDLLTSTINSYLSKKPEASPPPSLSPSPSLPQSTPPSPLSSIPPIKQKPVAQPAKSRKKWIAIGGAVILVIILFAIFSTSHPAPTARTQNILFSENFTDPSAEWESISHDAYGEGASYQNGTLYIKATNPPGTIWCHTLQQSFSDFILDVNITHIDGTLNDLEGANVRIQNFNNGYYVAISPNGYYRIWEYDGSNVKDLISPTKSSYINTGVSATNHLTVRCKGNMISFGVNGDTLDTITDNTYQAGTIGLTAAALDANSYTVVAYDNLVIRAY